MKLLVFLILLPMVGLSQNGVEKMYKRGVDTSRYIPVGIKVGEKAPQIVGISVDGKKINSTEILKTKPIVLIFYRGQWCPVCNRYLSNLNDSLQFITDKNAEILVVGPEPFDKAQKVIEKTNASFTLMPDTTLKTLKDYDVLFTVTQRYQNKINTLLLTDIAKNNGKENAELPVPATYIIGKDGVIKWRHFDYNYNVRATVKQILDNLNN